MSNYTKNYNAVLMPIGTSIHRELNRDEYYPVELIEVILNGPLKEKSIIDHKLLEMVPSLSKYENSVLLPYLIACNVSPNGRRISAVKDGNRTAAIYSGEEIEIDISFFDSSRKSEAQGYFIELKGVGTKVSKSGIERKLINNVKEEGIKKEIQKYIQSSGGSIEVITGRDYEFERPLGSQTIRNALRGIDGIKRSQEYGLQVLYAPIAFVHFLPKEAEDYARGIEESGNIRDRSQFSMVQVVRLMPSNLRGIYLTNASNSKLIELCKQISDKPEDLEMLAERLAADVIDYAEIISRSTKREGKETFWLRTANIDIDYNWPQPRLSWHFMKDIVLSLAGSTWSDEECFCNIETAKETEVLQHQKVYVTCLFADYIDLIGSILYAKDVIRNDKEIRQRGNYSDDAILTINKAAKRSDLISLRYRESVLDVNIQCTNPEMKDRKFLLPKNILTVGKRQRQ